MGDPLRDDTLQASFAMYDYASHAKCFTECVKCRFRYLTSLKCVVAAKTHSL